MPGMWHRFHNLGKTFMALRELALEWARANGATPQLEGHFCRLLDQALPHKRGCMFLVGRGHTRSRKAFLLQCFCGELFTFQLTLRQARQLKLNDGMVRGAISRNEQFHGPRAEPPVRLESVTLEQTTALDADAPLKGMLRYSTGRYLDLPIVLQVVLEPPVSYGTTRYIHGIHLLPGERDIPFCFQRGGGHREPHPYAGPLPLFFQFCTTAEPAKPEGLHPWMPGYHTIDMSPAFPSSGFDSDPPLGEPYVLPPDVPLSPAFHGHCPPLPSPKRSVQHFRGLSDFRAVFVDFVPGTKPASS
jgi:hypothetical protein